MLPSCAPPSSFEITPSAGHIKISENAQREATKHDNFDKGPEFYRNPWLHVYRSRSGKAGLNFHRNSRSLVFSSIERPSDRAIDQTTERSSDRAINRATERPTERPSDRATERPAERPAERPSDRSSDRSKNRFRLKSRCNGTGLE